MDMTLIQAGVVIALGMTGVLGLWFRRLRQPLQPARADQGTVAAGGCTGSRRRFVRSARTQSLEAMGFKADRDIVTPQPRTAGPIDSLGPQANSILTRQTNAAELERTQRALAEAELALAQVNADHESREIRAHEELIALGRRLNLADKRIKSQERKLADKQDDVQAISERASQAVEHALSLETETVALCSRVKLLQQELSRRDKRVAELQASVELSLIHI